MDKTILNGINRKIDNDNYTESFLCDEIHDNMKMLAFFHPFSDDLKNCFTKGMFVRSNPQAFPHVMKYLFTICDPIEFRKKFCWPLFNKAAEATFRNSTLEFLNKLNGKYSLGFGELKNKIVVFPGGMEFMRMIYELTKLVMRITLKRNAAFETENQKAITYQDANQKLQEILSFHEKGVVYCSELQRSTKELKSKTVSLTELSENLMKHCQIDSTIRLDADFINKWKEIQRNFTSKELRHDMLRIKRFQHNSEMLETRINVLLETKVVNWDMDNFSKFMVHMQKLLPIHYEDINKIIKNNQINLEKLYLIFDLVLPTILSHVIAFKPRSMDVLKYEREGIDKLSSKTTAVFQRVMIYNQKITAHMISDQDVFVEGNGQGQTPGKHFHIKSLILATPPISYDAVQRSENAVFRAKRISVMEDMIGRQGLQIANSKQLSTISENTMLMTPAKGRNTNLSGLISPLRSCNTTKLDPLLMLRTIQKKDKFRQPQAFKSKSQLKKSKDKPNETMPNIVISKPDFSSTIINSSKEKNEDHNQTVLNSMTSPLADITDQQLNSTGSFVGKHSLLQHFASFESNEPSVNRSPSGRIEGGFSAEFESTVIMSSVIRSCDRKKVVATSQATYRNHLDDIENRMDGANVANRSANKLNNMLNLIAENGESILNISDSVLKTVNDSEYFGND